MAAAVALIALGLTAAAGFGSENTTRMSAVATGLSTGAPAARSAQCLLCHDFDPMLSHPIGVEPLAGMGASPELPLEQGRITCLTCHDGIEPDHRSGGSGGGTAQSDFGTTSLCSRCHDERGSGSADMHATGLRRAHLPGAEGGWAVRSGRRAGASSDGSLESDACLTCHDGAMASDASRGFGSLVLGMPTAGPDTHPVSVQYLRGDSFAADRRLRPESSLDARVRLIDHRVECTSCHSPYSTEPGHLVMSNEGSRLCLSCHEL